MSALDDPTPEAVAAGRELLARHARSFSLAGLALDEATLDEAAVCYALCRVADDLVDEAPDYASARVAIDELRDELRGRRQSRPLVRAWIRLALRRNIPMAAAWRLVDTIARDAGPVRVADDAELRDYAEGVAGTVGAMMAAVLGGTSARARHAADRLGVAMQYTNIARDVAEDAGRDRVYLPATRLTAAGVTTEQVLAGTADRAALFGVVRDLVALAEPAYDAAYEGLVELSFRPRVAGFLALHLYREIGRELVRRGPVALAARTRLTRWQLVRTLGSATWALAASWAGHRPAPALIPHSAG